ncbi:tyrosine-type recombinase/integrase [Sphingomonas sp. CCH5-D11]|uniref:tyrosine-type recombinase/integrase n=1 Tax=Sphingomonas sp. CCH5-D11 TaxID=1768786 RepID=UPI00082A8BA4|nr:hypothetical protein [Sphingomonas sp. CCH5-D11]
MPRENSPCINGEFWLDFRRDGKAAGVYQIAWYDTRTRQVRYRSTRTTDLAAAKSAIHAHAASERAMGKQEPQEARVVPLLSLYWNERGHQLTNHDQTHRSLRTFIAFLEQDRIGLNAVVTDLVPVVFERFRKWRMGPHRFDIDWGGKATPYESAGVSGDTVARNLNDIRAALNHAEINGRVPYVPKVKTVEAKHLNPLRERVLTLNELGRIFWYAKQDAALFRFVALQLCTSVRPDAAKQFNPLRQYDDRTGLIDLQPGAAPRTKKRNAIIPAIRPMRVVLRAWAKEGYRPVASNKTAWRIMRRTLGLSADVYPKTIRHTIATWLYNDPTVPERQVSEMLGHGSKLHRTSLLYAKYDPAYLSDVVRALTTIWRQVSGEARRFGADHLLSTGRNEQGRFLARSIQKV